MNCPECGHEMESGVVQSNGLVAWNREHKPAILGIETELLDQYPLWTTFDGWRCRNCRLVLIKTIDFIKPIGNPDEKYMKRN